MPRSYLSTGSTVLNMACADTPWGGIVPGHYVWFVGDSVSGKTWLAYTLLAEAARNPSYDNYRFIVDQPEVGALFDIAAYFGQTTADRIETPYEDGPSQLLEDFYYWLDDALTHAEQNNEPFIGVLDSFDALTTNEDQKKFQEGKTARRGGKKAAGSYGMGKAKMNSQYIRDVIPRLHKTGSILLIISQTRDNVDPSTYAKKTHAGGRALRFYATFQLWTSKHKELKRTVNGKDRQMGIVSRCQIKKNRLTGKEREVLVPIYHSHGIDDVGGCVGYLVEESHWTQDKSGIITATEFGVKGNMEKVCRAIIDSRGERVLQSLCGDVWAAVEAKTVLDRPRRYV